jgi:hypothetical protein
MGQPGTDTGTFEADEFNEAKEAVVNKANENGERSEGFHCL